MTDLSSLSIMERIALHSCALTVAAAVRRATPEDVDSLAAAAYLAVRLCPSYEDSAGFARDHGFPVPDRDLWEAAQRKLLEVASLVNFGPEVAH